MCWVADRLFNSSVTSVATIHRWGPLTLPLPVLPPSTKVHNGLCEDVTDLKIVVRLYFIQVTKNDLKVGNVGGRMQIPT